MRKQFNHVENAPKLHDLKVEENDGMRFYVSPSGRKLPSITTVLGRNSKKSIDSWIQRVGHEEADRIRRRATDRGTKLHSLVEKYLKNENNLFEGVMPDLRQNFIDMKSGLLPIDNISHIEAPLYSESLGVAGRTDLIAEYNQIPSVIDFKTSTKEKPEHYIENYFMQSSGYQYMYKELTGIIIPQIVIIIAVDGRETPQVFIKDPDKYIGKLIDSIKSFHSETEKVIY